MGERGKVGREMRYVIRNVLACMFAFSDIIENLGDSLSTTNELNGKCFDGEIVCAFILGESLAAGVI